MDGAADAEVCVKSVCEHTQGHKHEGGRDAKGQRVALLMGVNATLLSCNHTHTSNQCVMPLLGFCCVFGLSQPFRMGVMMVDSRLPALMEM